MSDKEVPPAIVRARRLAGLLLLLAVLIVVAAVVFAVRWYLDRPGGL
jgi:hypothetical protein